MSFFDRDRQEQPKQEAPVQADRSEQIIGRGWPSRPDDAGQVPSLQEIADVDPDIGIHAAQLLKGAEPIAARALAVEYQVVVSGKMGPVTLPALVQAAEREFCILYGFAGDWDEASVNDLLNWTLRVRAAEQVADLEIVMVHDGDGLPIWVPEIISRLSEHLMIIKLLPYLEERPEVNARLFAQSFEFHTGRQLKPGIEALVVLDSYIKERLPYVPDESFYKKYMTTTYGSFLGEMIRRETGAIWTSSPDPKTPTEVLKLGDLYINPYAKVSKYLRGEEEQPGLEDYLTAITRHYGPMDV